MAYFQAIRLEEALSIQGTLEVQKHFSELAPAECFFYYEGVHIHLSLKRNYENDRLKDLSLLRNASFFRRFTACNNIHAGEGL